MVLDRCLELWREGWRSTVNILWGSGFDPYYHTQFDDMPLQTPSALNLCSTCTL